MEYLKNFYKSVCSNIIPSAVVPEDDFPTSDDNENLELFCLIWLDANVNGGNARDTEQQLRSIINHLKKFQDVKQCQQYIEERSEKDRLLLIVSGQLGKEIVPSIHQLRQVTSIYVYCHDKETHEQWALKFAKVKAVIVELDQLVSRIKSDHKIQKKVEEPVPISIVTTNPDKSTAGVDGGFVFFQVLIDCLLRLKSTETDKEELINFCQNSHKGNSTELNNIREFEKDYSPDKVLWWYAKESFFYKTLNGALRTQNIHIIFLFRGFIFDMHRQLQEHQAKNSLRVYRCQKISSDELKALKAYINQFISINSFFSTSTDETKARSFLDADTSSDLERVLFEIDADPKMVTTKPFADISPLSAYDESEVLFMPGSIFRLQSIDRDPAGGQIWIMKLILCSDDEHDLKQVLFRIKEQAESEETNLRTLAKVLWKMGKLDFATKYLERLLKELSPNDSLCVTLYQDLADLTSQAGNYEMSMKWYKKLGAFKPENQSADALNRDQANNSIVPTQQQPIQPLPPNETPCWNGLRCHNPVCQYQHPEGWSVCKEGVQCINYECSSNHPPGRKTNSRDGNRPKNRDKLKPFRPTNDPKSPTSGPFEIIELSGAKYSFLERFGADILRTIRKESGITDVKVRDRGLRLSGDTTALANVKYFLAGTLHEQNVTIAVNLEKYLDVAGGRLMKKFLNKYHLGISFNQITVNAPSTNKNMGTTKNDRQDQLEDKKEKQDDNDGDVNQSMDEEEDNDDDDNNPITLRGATAIPANSKHDRSSPQKFIEVTLCNNSEDSLSKAVKELQSYTLCNQSCWLTQDEITYILKQSELDRRTQKKSAVRNKCCEVKYYLARLTLSIPNVVAQISVDYRNGVMLVRVKGFKSHVDNAVSKIKTYLADNVQTEVQLPISKVMKIFLRTKASSDIQKLEKTTGIKITIYPPPPRGTHGNNEEDDNNSCLKLSGSNSHIDAARVNIENFLALLSEQEKQFPCQTWDISRDISQILRPRLKESQRSYNFDAIGWIKPYTAAERRETEPNIAISIVGFNEEAFDSVVEQCQNIISGYVIWKLSADEYRAIHHMLIVKESPSKDEFQKQWDTIILLDRDTSTITIRAASKEIADDIKEALRNLGESKPQVNRITEVIHIQLNIRRFVNQAIESVLDEARSQRIYIESKNRDRLKLQGRSDAVTEIKQKINFIIDDIKQKTATSRLQLSSVESDLLRADKYKITKSIERVTNTTIRDDTATTSRSTSDTNDYVDIGVLITSVINNRGQRIIVQKGDITQIKNIDAIITAANGTLYHAGGVDKAIADAAGPALDQECKQLIVKNGGLPFTAGEAVKTTAGNLPFKCVIHAISPQYSSDNQQERPLLFSSILSSLRLAENEHCTSVALPAISFDTFGFALPDCTNIIIRAVKQFFADYPQSKLRKVILLDMNDAACSSFAREVVIDHSNALADDNDIISYQLSPLTAKWCWQVDSDEKIYDENHSRLIETEFQQYLKTSIMPTLVIPADNSRSGTIVNCSIHFRPDVKELLINNPGALNSRLVCGHQMKENSGPKRDIIRYPGVQNTQTTTVAYSHKPLDSYSLEIVTTKVDWDIISIDSAAVTEAETAIRKAIEDATISELYSVKLDKDIAKHKEQINMIAIQKQIQINFQDESAGQLSMVLKGFKSNVKGAKSEIKLYADRILLMQTENDNVSSIPKESDGQGDGCQLQ